MAKNKLKKFADLKTMDFVFEPVVEDIKTKPFLLKGNWTKEFFKNDNPIILELGCGMGEYTIELAKMFPDKNFIGVDIKGARIWQGANQVNILGLKNVAFLRIRIDFIDLFFGENEVDEIWLTFSDPQKEKPRKRLSSKLFIDRYRKFLKPEGIIHLKTDSDLLFESTLEQIEENKYHLIQSYPNLYGVLESDIDETTKKIYAIKTHYEKIFFDKGYTIKYCKFHL